MNTEKPNLETFELKAFIPAKNFELAKQFYLDIGFTKASDESGIAYFYCGNCSFLLQDFYNKTHAEHTMLHLLVEDVSAWHATLKKKNIVTKYDVQISAVQKQPWGISDFTLHDPSGVLWRIGQNI